MLAGYSETSVNFYQTTWRHNPEVDVAALERIFDKFTTKQKSYNGKTQIRVMTQSHFIFQARN
jgi:hypothetical protein